ncbi:hypothetical protein Tel_01560 [Candidatus Tenderia electrophaga]|jgi:limonene-1,2-epoxide hydrolase|uniref:SnoaL-like domain-containing protein n=1 Tax=Candidatus Tenderia electrophaga TaxID=1748243 RepID=A0A0S2THP5_9GAMM|nr:hypothetical protein Tel_01560 [Candidatus Tenderia electrophaga]
MPDLTPQQIIDAYLEAIEARDFERARRHLDDRHFQYRSPVLNSDGADEFIANISHIGAILARIERRHIFVDGADVCHVLRFITSWSTATATDVVQWSKVKDGKIRSIETFFDARVYREMFTLEGE